MRRAALILLLTLAACGSDETRLLPTQYTAMAGWPDDTLSEPLRLFKESCRANASRADAYRSRREGPVGDPAAWSRVCAEAALLPDDDDAAARQFFESEFSPVKVETQALPQGLMTGYYEPILRGARTREAPYLFPVYGVPRDLVPGQAYLTRGEIEARGLGDVAPVLLYVDDPVGLFFLHIQGSGKVRLRDGTLVGLQYAAQNGHAYVGIGRWLREQGELETVTLQTIRQWLGTHPDRMQEVMNLNPSYVFFRLGDGDKPAKGALGLRLTALRSLAIDDDRAAYGVPTYVDTSQARFFDGVPVPLQRLFISQDTGGALHGPHRGDIFYGEGEREEWLAGHQNAPANVYWLLPRVQKTPAPAPEDPAPAPPAP